MAKGEQRHLLTPPRRGARTATSTSLRRALVATLIIALSTLSLAGMAPVALAAPGDITIGAVEGMFFTNPGGSGSFNATPSDTPAFVQSFPVLNFNPPSTSFCSNPVGVDITTRPFTDVVPQPDGTCTAIPAQGNGFQAGVGALFDMQVAFTTTLTVSGPSDVTFSFYSDDGWILGVGPGAGGQPTYVSGPRVNPPVSGTTPFHLYPVMGSYNVPTSPVGQDLVVHFPAAGSYPAEFEYVECCAGALSFTVNANGAPIPPTPAVMTTQASASVTAPASIYDTATILGLIPTGTITFNLYGPGDVACATSIHTSTISVDGNGDYSSTPFTANVAGTYRWVASYGGDANNAAVVSSCGEPNEQVEVTRASPTLTTTPSGPAPAGGTVSDTATLSGGAAPTGSVTFTLFAPGDTTCTTPIATKTGTISGGSAASGPVTVGAPGTYNWVASYGGDASNNPAASLCGVEKVVVTAQTLTGRAYGVSATISLIGGPAIGVVPTPDTGSVSTTSSMTREPPCVASLGGMVTAHTLCVKLTTVAFPGSSAASASVEDATVSVPGVPVITLRMIKSTSTTTCAGSTGATTIDYLKVGDKVVIAQPTDVAPNTRVTVGVVSLVLNEQIPFTTPDKGLTVNAVHIKVNAVGVAKVDTIISSSKSDIGNCP